MSISEPYLHPESNQDLCIICNATITKKNEQGIVRDWCKIKEHALKWKDL